MTIYDVVHVTNRSGFAEAEKVCQRKMKRAAQFNYAIAEPDQLRHFHLVGARDVVIDGNVSLTTEQWAMVDGLIERGKQPTEAA
jgi:hypothetical protein